MLLHKAATRAGRDRGASAVEYVALLLLVATLFGVLASSGVVRLTVHNVHIAICEIFRIDPCDPGTLPPGAAPSGSPNPSESPGPPQNPWPTGRPGPSGSPGPTNRPTSGPGSQPSAGKPTNPCYQSIEIGYGEANLTVPIRVINIRGGIRIGYQIRKIGTPGKPDKWEVTIYGFGELAAATPGTPTGQFGSDSTSGEVTGNAWLGVNLSGGETYIVNSEKEANALPLKYAESRALQAADLPLKAAKLVLDPAISLAGHIPFIGGLIKKAAAVIDIPQIQLPARDSWSIEAGPTAGFSGKVKLFDSLFNGSVSGRYWHLDGVKGSANGDLTYTMKEAAELEPSAIIDLDRLLGEVKLAKQKNAMTDGALNAIEKASKSIFGYELTIPPAVRAYLKENWPTVGGTVKFKTSVSYQVTVDKNGHPVKFTEILDHQTNWSVRGQLQGENGDNKGSLNIQVPAPFVTSHREVEQRTLGLQDPQNMTAVQDFLNLEGPLSLVSPVTSPLMWTPQYNRLQKQIDANGTKTILTYDSSVGNGKFTGEGNSGKGLSLLELKVEHETDTLSNAQIWDNAQQKWIPWTDCYRKH